MSLVLKIIPALIFWGIFIYTIILVPYPKSLTEASAFQLFIFFLPLLMAVFFTINIFLNFMIRSAILAFGIVVILVLKALELINPVTLGILTAAIILLWTYFKKENSNLNSNLKIPKLKSLRRKR